MEIRLNKYVQENFGISRRKFVDLVQKNRVFLNDNIVESYSLTVKTWDKLEIRYLKIEKTIKLDENKQSDIIIFNKPVWFVCSKADKHNKTIYELLPKKFENYFYIGRLDKDSRGLLMMTNDSDMVNKYEHPSNKVEKEYIVQIDKPFDGNDYTKIKRWIKSDDDLLELKHIKYFENRRKNMLNIVLWEWKKRHIRRMLGSLGYDVLDLQRVREWQFVLGNVKEWNWMAAKRDNKRQENWRQIFNKKLSSKAVVKWWKRRRK